MNSGETKLNLVPSYLKASSPDLLREAMLINNLKSKSFIQYQDISFQNGYWFCWFYQEIDFIKEIVSKVSENKS